jgi:hypothetical protein
LKLHQSGSVFTSTSHGQITAGVERDPEFHIARPQPVVEKKGRRTPDLFVQVLKTQTTIGDEHDEQK